MMATHWKSDLSDLRQRAAFVRIPVPETRMPARTATRCLSGVIGEVSRRWGTEAMQAACAELVRSELAWSSSLGKLPLQHDGRASEATQLIAVVARGMLELAGVDNMRAALAFWASESDPAVWASIAG